MLILHASSAKEGMAYMKVGNYQAALEIFKSAALQGDKVAQRNLGVMYSGGLGVKKDNYKASYWLNMADAHQKDYTRVSYRN